MLSDGDITRIGQRIVRGYGPLVVGVFGSYAIGKAHEGSDLDVFVVKRTPEPRPARRHAVLCHLAIFAGLAIGFLFAGLFVHSILYFQLPFVADDLLLKNRLL
jgi:predicted nucleotidyltransferase